MNKYTAEDFANARFAEHPNPEYVDARFAARMNTDPTYPWLLDGVPGNTDEAMSHSGWVPVPTKPTITQREFDTAFATQWRWNVSDIQLKLDRLGITITPDPEPTNAEKLADVYRDWCGMGEVPNSLIRFMDEAGVTAPEET